MWGQHELWADTASQIFAELGHFYGYLRPRLHLSPGQDTYVFGTESELQGGQADLSQLPIVGLSTERTPATALGFQPRLGPVGVIIDQSVLLSSPLPSPLDNPSYALPQSLVSLVQTVAITFSTSARGDRGSQWASSATPSYLVVHENVLPLLKRALQAYSSVLSTQVHPVKQASRVLSPARNAASLLYLPIFVMTSLEEILSAPDTLPASTTTYLYGDSGFTSYFTQQYPAESVCINCIPEDKLGEWVTLCQRSLGDNRTQSLDRTATWKRTHSVKRSGSSRMAVRQRQKSSRCQSQLDQNPTRKSAESSSSAETASVWISSSLASCCHLARSQLSRSARLDTWPINWPSWAISMCRRLMHEATTR